MDASSPIADALSSLDTLFARWVVGPVKAVLFYDVAFWTDAHEVPFIVLWLVLGALFFTLRFAFINLRAFKHAVAVTAGRYDDPAHEGELSHFQALSSALSATVGLGNIAGVAVAVGTGGPGAVVWMIVAGFLGMSSKFAECTLGQLYRVVDPSGRVSGGPMRYLDTGLAEKGWPRLGKALAGLFAVMCIGGSFGGGNMFQANQSYAQVANVLPLLDTPVGSIAYGVFIAALVGVVIIGGIRRIGTVAGYVVPIMCAVYVLAGLYVLIVHADEVPAAFGEILRQALRPEAAFGGVVGVMVQGFRRAAFSNEAGVGSAAIAHSAAATDEPVREGIVALLEPFIDTVVVCTMTALVVVITGAYLQQADGVVMTSWAFSSVIPWFPPVLAIAVLLFAFSTMISWSYYGERCWAYLLGPQSSRYYRAVFLLFIVLGAVLDLGSVIDFSDLMILGMSFPNILGAVLLSGRVRAALDDYWGRYRRGEMRPLPAGGATPSSGAREAP
ncbi:MAG: alanine/glycine:cation symporter family protein [Myxococcota bacterium]